jgi:hypothetical protein
MLKLSEIIPFPDAPGKQWQIIWDCPKCSGTGRVTYDHPNDPSAKDVDCTFCDEGKIKGFEPLEYYDQISDVQRDYPNSTVTLIPRRN